MFGLTGELGEDGSSIAWSNGFVWMKVREGGAEGAKQKGSSAARDVGAVGASKHRGKGFSAFCDHFSMLLDALVCDGALIAFMVNGVDDGWWNQCRDVNPHLRFDAKIYNSTTSFVREVQQSGTAKWCSDTGTFCSEFNITEQWQDPYDLMVNLEFCGSAECTKI